MILKINKYFAVFILLIFITQNFFASVPSVSKLITFDINGTQINADYADVFKYDNGNLLSDGTNKYAWDFENRLTEVKDNTDVVKVNYLYDAQGRRIAKVFPDGKKVYYYWLNDWQVIEERDELGNLLRENTPSVNIDRPLITTIYLTALGIDSTPYGGVNQIDVNYHQNSLGNVLALTDTIGQVIERYTFDLYGNLKVQDADGVVVERQPLSNFLFTGRELDLESGLYYFRNRYYSPKLAQFISTDPLDFVDGSNCYAYCNARYADMVDPLGLSAWDDVKDAVKGAYLIDKEYRENQSKKSFTEKAVEATPLLGKLYKEGKDTLNKYESNRDAGMGVVSSLADANIQKVNEMTGGQALLEGAFGIDRQSGEKLSKLDRGMKILQGVSQAVLTTVGGLQAKDAISKSTIASNADDAFHSTGSPKEILKDGFDPNYVDHKTNRYGKGTYVSDTSKTALAERPGGDIIKVELDIKKPLNVNKTYDYETSQSIAKSARRKGYDAIKFESTKSKGGTNYYIPPKKSFKTSSGQIKYDTSNVKPKEIL